MDTFGSSASGFPKVADPEAASKGYRAGYDDGHYAIGVPGTGTNTRGNGYAVTLEGRSFTDFTLDVQTRWASTVDTGAYGIVFRHGEKGGYDVMVNARGEVRIGKVVEGKRTIIRDWERMYSYRSGTQENLISVVCKGATFTVRLNGGTVATFTDTDLRFGEVGLAAVAWESPIEARFTSFRVAPPAEGILCSVPALSPR